MELIVCKNSVSQKDIISKIENFYKTNYPEYKYYLNVKEDKEWKYYRDFLYPNEETRNYMADQSVLRNLEEAGDNLTKVRRVDHWLYFLKESEMNKCKADLEKLGFKVQSAGINKETNLPFELQVWRIDNVDINSIYPITSDLRKRAKKKTKPFPNNTKRVLTKCQKLHKYKPYLINC